MKLVRNPAVGLAAAILGIAALLGGSLGMATAATRPGGLSQGVNLIAGPLASDVEPGKFVSCLPPTSWKAMYIWRHETQTWNHYFNTKTSDGIPGFVNSPEAGGVSVVVQASGVAIIMAHDVDESSAYFIDGAADNCPS
jgi:hypothetical protein